MRTTPIALSVSLVALLLAPTALAGSPEDPEMIDARLDAALPPANAWADIEKAWIEQPDEAKLVMTIQLHVAPPTSIGTVYAMVFDANGSSYHVALVHLDEVYFEAGPFDRERFEPSGGSEGVQGTFTPGPGSRLVIEFPLEMIPGATELTNIVAYSVDIKSGFADRPFVVLDEAVATRDFPVIAPAPTPAPAGASTEPSATPSGTVAPAATGSGASPAPSPEGAERDVPAPGLLLAIVALLGALWVRRRS